MWINCIYLFTVLSEENQGNDFIRYISIYIHFSNYLYLQTKNIWLLNILLQEAYLNFWVNKFVMLRALTTPLVYSNLSDNSSVNIDNINQFELIFVLKMWLEING